MRKNRTTHVSVSNYLLMVFDVELSIGMPLKSSFWKMLSAI